MSEFDLDDLSKIYKQEDIMEYLDKHGIIKEEKFKKQYQYERDLHKLQKVLLRLQEHVITNNLRVLIIFEGRDATGKGGTIKRMVKNMNTKKYRVVALSKPTEAEDKQWYFQRYIKHLPQEGEIVFFDRSWYNRAVVEQVFGFSTEEQYDKFMNQVNPLEEILVDEGIKVFKIFLTISKNEQEDRLQDRRDEPLKRWKIGSLDQQAIEKWDDYSKYIDKMLDKTATKKAPWIEVETDDKKTARLQVIQYIVNQFEDLQDKEILEIDDDVIKLHD